VTPLGEGKIFIEMPEGQTANAIRRGLKFKKSVEKV